MKLHIVTVAFLASLTLAACGDPYYYSRPAKGALIGGTVGAGAGALVGSASGRPITGALVGAGVGALGGTAIGAALDAGDARRERDFDSDYGDPYYYSDQRNDEGFQGHHHRHHHHDSDEDEGEDD
jgi:hypothetical protein